MTLWHRPRYLKCYQLYTSHYCQPQTWNPAVHYSHTPFLWYLISVVIYERYRKSSISWVIWACNHVCLLGVILKKTQELYFELAILYGIEVFAIQPDFVARDVALCLSFFIVRLLLKLLYMMEVLLADGHQLLELGGKLFHGFWF